MLAKFGEDWVCAKNQICLKYNFYNLSKQVEWADLPPKMGNAIFFSKANV